MTDTTAAADDLAVASSRLDASLLRYVLLHRTRMNMLVLDRTLARLADEDGRLHLRPGETRSQIRHRAEATMQLAVEIELAHPATAQWIDGQALRRQAAVDAAYYQSARWLAGLPPDMELALPPPGIAAAPGRSADAQGLADGLDAYLQRCTRLEEDERHRRRRDVAATAGTGWTEELPETERVTPAPRELHDLAWRIAQRLRPVVGLDDWRDDAELRDEALTGFAMPPPEVFDALLVGTRSLIVPSVPDSAWQWAFEATGELTAPGREREGRPAHDLQDVSTRLRALEESLRVLLGLPAGDAALQRLADGWSVLPTTPAWPDVRHALDRLEGSEARRTATDDARRTVVEYQRIVDASYGVVVRCLCAAAFFGRLATLQRERSAASQLRAGIGLLSEGLRFPATHARGIGTKLGRLHGEFVQLGAEHGVDEVPAPWPTHALRARPEDAGETLDALLTSAADDASALAPFMDAVVERAWERARVRLARFCRDGRVDDAHFAELVCAARGVGPGEWLALDPRRMTLQRWSRLCIEALRPSAAVPVWVAVIALNRLGVNALSPAQQDALLAVAALVERERGVGIGLAGATARHDKAWHATSRAVGSVILVRKRISPMTEHWHKPPTQGLVLLVTADEVDALVEAKALLQALPQQQSLQREEPMDEGDDFGPLRVRIRNAMDNRSLTVGLIQRLGASVLRSRGDASALLDPEGPDDLLTAPRAG